MKHCVRQTENDAKFCWGTFHFQVIWILQMIEFTQDTGNNLLVSLLFDPPY